MSFNEAKEDAAQAVRDAKYRTGATWAQIAERIGRSKEWTVAALLGMHPVPADEARMVGEMLDLDRGTIHALRRQPYRTALGADADDPTIYRFREAINVYGTAIKELIHEEFGDGIMSAIDFDISVTRREDPRGDRVVVTFDGKFLAYPDS